MSSLFEDGGPENSLFEAIRTGVRPPEVETRQRADAYWSTFEPFADRNFASEFRIHSHERYWEMYLTCLLLEQGRPIECPKPGPDILVDEPSGRIWIEAVAASRGASESPDRVPDFDYGVAFEYPEEQILLRYRTAIDQKHGKFDKYATDGIVASSETCVVAVHAGGTPLASSDDEEVPRIAQAVFPFGEIFVQLEATTGTVIRSGREYRPAIAKSSGSVVSTDLFLDPQYAAISAIFFSSAGISNPPIAPGADIIVVHNPLATNPLERGWLGCGAEYVLEARKTAYELVRTR